VPDLADVVGFSFLSLCIVFELTIWCQTPVWLFLGTKSVTPSFICYNFWRMDLQRSDGLSLAFGSVMMLFRGTANKVHMSNFYTAVDGSTPR
jgi:hypothetical protein